MTQITPCWEMDRAEWAHPAAQTDLCWQTLEGNTCMQKTCRYCLQWRRRGVRSGVNKRVQASDANIHELHGRESIALTKRPRAPSRHQLTSSSLTKSVR